ncbi:hypothetical protein [Echinicola shivajiensis]|uniref:hypothetical protein n=1 Tax=Echinicola shivajiensis TaxID=1035916 RepID=UPI001BFC4A5B|nr:hypothetical protein [Echinicola shivajiensis]
MKFNMFKHSLSVLLSSLLIVSLFTACSKDDDLPGLPKGKRMKFTISTSSFQSGDYISLTINGNPADGQGSTIFKLNGDLLNNQKSITIDEDEILAGTVTLESVVPLSAVYIIAGGFSSDDKHSYILKIEPEIDDKAEAALTHTFDEDVSTVQYEF